MQEVWQTALAPVNLPFTVLILLMAGYWILSALGLVNFEDVDASIEAGDAGGDGDGDLSGEGNLSQGVMHNSLRFLHAGEVPLMIVLTILIFNIWLLSLVANWYFNPALEGTRALLFLPGVLIAAALGTRLAAAPLRPLFRALHDAPDDEVLILGRVGRVLTSTVNDRFGMARIETGGAPLDLQVRAEESHDLHKGDTVLFVAHDESTGFYRVKPHQQPELT